MVDQVIELDAEWRSVRYELDNLQKESNTISKEVGQIKKVRQCHRGKAMRVTTAMRPHAIHALWPGWWQC